MSKVYVLHDNPYAPKNFIPAEQYGEIEYLFTTHISKSQISRCISQLREKLRHAGSDDWLIPVGHPALIFASGHVWFDITRNLNVLVWDQQTAGYIPLRMNIHG